MSDRRRELRAWLEFATELGIDGLPRPARPLVPAARPPAPAPVAVAPPPPPPTAAEPEPEAGVQGGAALDRMRRVLSPGKAAAAPSAPRPVVPPPAPVVAPPAAPAPPSGAAPGRRLDVIPAELLGVPEVPATLDDIRAEIGDCQRCRLAGGRTHIVFGVGNPQAELVFVGEGPGRDEDLQGEPFVGKAGQLLNDIIRAIGRSRAEVYICNVVKCRPPENRTPEPDEVAACRGFLFQQLGVVRPRVVVALGKPAAETLLRMRVSITAIRGQEFNLFGAILIPTFHPAYLLRNPAAKREVWEDMKRVRDLLASPPGA